MKSAKDKTAYRREHESNIILHEAAARALRAYAGDGGKLLNLAKLQADYAKLTESKNALRVEYGNLKKQAKEYGVIKKNVDSILDPGAEPRARGKDRNAEL
jgi:cytochrome oxidase Cu insertion factor (SCO1/SenC/PrrC family)